MGLPRPKVGPKWHWQRVPRLFCLPGAYDDGYRWLMMVDDDVAVNHHQPPSNAPGSQNGTGGPKIGLPRPKIKGPGKAFQCQSLAFWLPGALVEDG